VCRWYKKEKNKENWRSVWGNPGFKGKECKRIEKLYIIIHLLEKNYKKSGTFYGK